MCKVVALRKKACPTNETAWRSQTSPESPSWKGDMRFPLLPIPSNPYNCHLWVSPKATEGSAASQHCNASCSWALGLCRSDETQNVCDKLGWGTSLWEAMKGESQHRTRGFWSKLTPSSAENYPFGKWVLACYEVLIKIKCLTVRYQMTLWSELPMKPRCRVYMTAIYQHVPWVDDSDFFDTYFGWIAPFPLVYT